MSKQTYTYVIGELYCFFRGFRVILSQIGVKNSRLNKIVMGLYQVVVA